MALQKTFLAACAKCGKTVLPHHVCNYCGFYDGKEIIDVFAKLDKKERKKREKEEAITHETHGKRPSGEATPELNPEELSRK